MSNTFSLHRTGVSCALMLATALGGVTLSAGVASAKPDCHSRSHHGDCEWHSDRGRHDRDYYHRPEYHRPETRVIIVEPRVGHRIHGGERIDYHRYHRLPPLGRHEEYRVYDNRVVRVNSDTLAVLAVVGLASALLSN